MVRVSLGLGLPLSTQLGGQGEWPASFYKPYFVSVDGGGGMLGWQDGSSEGGPTEGFLRVVLLRVLRGCFSPGYSKGGFP